MSKSPAFQFYPKDFLTSLKVYTMTMEERGVYITLLCSSWLENGIPNDSRVLQGLCNYGSNRSAKWEKVWAKVSTCFVEKNGLLYNERLEEERKKQERWREKCRKGGQKSAEKKRDIKGSSTTLPTKAQVKGNSSSSSSSSSSPASKDNKPPSSFDEDAVMKHFAAFWDAYPKKVAKKDALKAFRSLLKKVDVSEIAAATNGYNDYLKQERVDRGRDLKKQMRFIKHPATFLRENRWKDFIGFQYRPKL